MTAPAGAPPVFPHYRSSVRSRRSSLHFFHCRSSACPRRSSLSIFTAAAVTALAGALPVFPHCRSSECSPQERYLYFLTAPAVSAPAGVLPIFPHCRSSARSSRSLSPRPLPSPLPTTALPLSPSQQPHATIGIPPQLFLHCRSSACSSRNLLSISPLPQQCLLQQESSLYFPTAPAVTAPAGALSIFPLPQ